MKSVPKDFSCKLKRMREAFRDEGHRQHGLTVRELGQRAGIHYTRISTFESGRRIPGPKSLKKLADAFGLAGEEVDEFIASGREDARLNKTKQDFPLVPNVIQKRLLDEISNALQNRGAKIREVYDDPACDLMWVTDSDEWFAVQVVTVSGRSQGDVLSKIKAKVGASDKGKDKS